MKYSYKELKQVMKNIAVMAKHRRNWRSFDNRQYIRHVYLAYQWIRTQDLTKAENPATNKQSIRPELILLILKEWEFPMELTHQQLIDKLHSQGFKIKKIIAVNYIQQTGRTIDSFMKPHYSLMINPIISEEHLTSGHFWSLIKNLFLNANYPLKLSYSNMATFISFTNKRGSSLSLRFHNSFIESKHLVQYNFTIVDQVQSTGIFNLFLPDSYSYGSSENIIMNMINEITADEKYKRQG